VRKEGLLIKTIKFEKTSNLALKTSKKGEMMKNKVACIPTECGLLSFLQQVGYHYGITIHYLDGMPFSVENCQGIQTHRMGKGRNWIYYGSAYRLMKNA
jgi:hypothetical protein